MHFQFVPYRSALYEVLPHGLLSCPEGSETIALYAVREDDPDSGNSPGASQFRQSTPRRSVASFSPTTFMPEYSGS
jgi:hypothetical protein